MPILAESYDKFATLSGEFFFALHSEGLIAEVGSKVPEEFGYTIAELKMAKFADLIHPADLIIWEHACTHSRKIPSLQKIEFRFRESSGNYINLRCHLCYCMDRQGYLVKLRKLTHEQKQRLLLTSRIAVLGEVSAGIAHEINNPLTVIHARAFQLLQMVEQNNFDRSKVKAAVDSITQTSDKIAKLVKSLRAFAQSQDNAPLDSVNVRDLIQETLDFCKARFRQHEISVRVGAIPANLELECRLAQLEEALLNIFNNAYDAIVALPEKWIQVDAFDLGSSLEIHVTDSGAGIPEDVAENIMNPFFTTKEMGLGIGLGLSIVADIAEKHHGQVRLDRSTHHTKFILHLPKRQG